MIYGPRRRRSARARSPSGPVCVDAGAAPAHGVPRAAAAGASCRPRRCSTTRSAFAPSGSTDGCVSTPRTSRWSTRTGKARRPSPTTSTTTGFRIDLVNQGDVDLWGSEIEAMFAVTERFTIEAATGRANYEMSNPCINNGPFLFPPPMDDEHSLTGRYELPRPTGNFTFSLSYTKTGPMQTHPGGFTPEELASITCFATPAAAVFPSTFIDSRYEVPSYDLANLRVRYSPNDGKWTGTLFVNNLTDEVYANNAQSFGRGFWTAGGPPGAVGSERAAAASHRRLPRPPARVRNDVPVQFLLTLCRGDGDGIHCGSRACRHVLQGEAGILEVPAFSFWDPSRALELRAHELGARDERLELAERDIARQILHPAIRRDDEPLERHHVERRANPRRDLMRASRRCGRSSRARRSCTVFERQAPAARLDRASAAPPRSRFGSPRNPRARRETNSRSPACP